jgi:hypothetical protein
MAIPPGLREHYQDRSLDGDGGPYALAAAVLELADQLAALHRELARNPAAVEPLLERELRPRGGFGRSPPGRRSWRVD